MVIFLVDWACKASGKRVNIKISKISKQCFEMSEFKYVIPISKLVDVEMFSAIFSCYYAEDNFATKTMHRSRTCFLLTGSLFVASDVD